MATDIETTPLLADRIGGASYRDLGRKYRLNHETARQLVIQEERRLIGTIIFDLIAALKDELNGVPESDIQRPTLMAVHGPSWTLTMRLVMWTLDTLREAKVPLGVETMTKPDGVAFILAITQDPEENSE